VEVAGFEPASSESSAGLLRAQPVRRSRVAAAHRRPAATPASLWFPSGPRGPSRRWAALNDARNPAERLGRNGRTT